MLQNFLASATTSLLTVTTAFSALPIGVSVTPTFMNNVARDAATTAIESIENLEVISTPDRLPISDERPRVKKISITAYSSTADQTDSSPFITANGTVVADGVVAANFLPFGTRVRIPKLYGDKEFVVADRMNKRFNQKIDIWMPSRIQAQQFGLRYEEIEILPAHSTMKR